MPKQLPEGHRYLNRLAPTPLVPIQLSPTDPRIWCKLEFLNPSGSTKDRIARYILEKAWRQGKLGPGDTVVEASSGSTSIAMALACAQMGINFIAVMPEGVSDERVMIIKAYGGAVRFTPRAEGIRGALAETERLAADGASKTGRVFLPRQFSNQDNADAHRLFTAREILDQLPGGDVDAVVSGVGTGGTLVGLYEGFKENGCLARPVLAKPVNLRSSHDAESCSCSFSQRIPGVVDSVSTIFRPERLADLLTIEVEDTRALEMTRALQARGFPVGSSSGLNFAAALATAAQMTSKSPVVVTVFPDRMERYFTTELFERVRRQ